MAICCQHWLLPVFWFARLWSTVGFMWLSFAFPQWLMTSKRHLFFFVDLLYFILCVWVFSLCVVWVSSTQGGQKRVLDCPELESPMVVSHPAQSPLQPWGISSDLEQSWPGQCRGVTGEFLHILPGCHSHCSQCVRPITGISNVTEKQLKVAWTTRKPIFWHGEKSSFRAVQCRGPTASRSSRLPLCRSSSLCVYCSVIVRWLLEFWSVQLDQTMSPRNFGWSFLISQ